MKIDMISTERGLLSFLLAKIHKTDPDLIVVGFVSLSFMNNKITSHTFVEMFDGFCDYSA